MVTPQYLAIGLITPVTKGMQCTVHVPLQRAPLHTSSEHCKLPCLPQTQPVPDSRNRVNGNSIGRMRSLMCHRGRHRNHSHTIFQAIERPVVRVCLGSFACMRLSHHQGTSHSSRDGALASLSTFGLCNRLATWAATRMGSNSANPACKHGSQIKACTTDHPRQGGGCST